MTRRELANARRSILLAAGGLAPDLPIGSAKIGFYSRKTMRWSKPGSRRPQSSA